MYLHTAVDELFAIFLASNLYYSSAAVDFEQYADVYPHQ